MVEGVAVSFESDDGIGGRANDPLVKEAVRQDIIENRFKSPLEASGLYDEYPFGDIYYDYGGYFNAYIQKTYGMEKYAELWKAMGTIVLSASLDPYEIGFYTAFRRTYGIPFPKAWADFRNSLALSGILDPPDILGPKDLAWLEGGMTGNDEGLYWIDARSNRAMRMDAATLEGSVLFDADSSWTISDASADSAVRTGHLLVSRAISLPDGRDRAETIVYDLAAKRFLAQTSCPDMREARFFRDGWVGIVSNLHNTDLVFKSEAGSKLLLPGSEEVMYSSPAVLDEKRIALIVAIGGKRNLGILDVDSGELSLLKPEGVDSELFTYMRQLSSSGSKLYFDYNSDDRLYKLGVLDGDELRIETSDYSGGVLWPRVAGGRVFYIGRFSEGDKICRYPGDAALVGTRTVAFSLERFDPRKPLAESAALVAAAGATAAVEPYSPLAYANPFNMWFLYPDLSAYDRSFRPFGLFYFQDPVAANTVYLDAGYDTSYPFADTSLEWVNEDLPVAFLSTIGDNLVYGASGPPERQSSASLSASLGLSVSPSPREMVIGLGGTVLDRGDGESGSPYTWGYSGWNATASGLLGWEGRLPGAAVSTSRGIDVLSYHDLDIASLAYKTEDQLVAAYDRVPLRLDIWGAWATSSILKLDATSTVFSSDRRPAYVEYETLNTESSNLLVEGTLDYRLADQAIHTNLLDLYFNRLLVDIGGRGAYFQNTVLSSVFARLSFDLAAAQGRLYGDVRVFSEIFARLDVSSPNDIVGWRLGCRISTDAGTSLRPGTFAKQESTE
jgi:hypothetical protein